MISDYQLILLLYYYFLILGISVLAEKGISKIGAAD